MHTFKKHFQKGGTYKVAYYYDGEWQKNVDEDKPLYVAWVDKGNVPEEVAYVPPKPLTQEQLKIRARREARIERKEEFNKRIWEASPEYTALQSDLADINISILTEK
jgi:hypothetical protein